MAHKHIGLDKFKEIIAGVVEETNAVVESPVKMMGNRAIAMLSPSKKAKWLRIAFAQDKPTILIKKNEKNLFAICFEHGSY